MELTELRLKKPETPLVDERATEVSPADEGTELGSLDVVGGNVDAGFLAHASIAFAVQLELTFASCAAVSESFNFEAYPQIDAPFEEIGEAAADAGCKLSLVSRRNGEGESAGLGEGDREGEGDKEVVGEGGASIADWLVIPFQTVSLRREPQLYVLAPDEGCGLSVDGGKTGVRGGSSSSGNGEAGWLVNPLHTVSRKRVPSPREGFTEASASRLSSKSEAVCKMPSTPPAASIG